MTSQLILKDGKFLRDGKEVPPRIGDAEQIALLKREERHLEYLEQCANDEGIPCKVQITDISYESNLSFTCICGNGILDIHTFHGAAPDEINPEFDFDGMTVRCQKCGSVYEIFAGLANIVK